jgi:PAS domain S-box-containing protein
MLWCATPEGAVDYCNHPWLDFASMTAEQAKGWGWAAAIYPEDRDGLLECWRSCLASGTPFDMEARMRRFDGAYRWFIFRANPLQDESGKILRWFGTNIEIEDRKRREEVLQAAELSWRQIIDSVPGFVYALSATGEPEFINRRTLEYFGKSKEELKDWSRLGIVHPDDLPRAIDALTQAIEAGEGYEIEHRCKRADGVYRWFQVRGCPARNTEGDVNAWYRAVQAQVPRRLAGEFQVGEVCFYFVPDDFPSAELNHARLSDGRGSRTPARKPLVFHLIEPQQTLALGL